MLKLGNGLAFGTVIAKVNLRIQHLDSLVGEDIHGGGLDLGVAEQHLGDDLTGLTTTRITAGQRFQAKAQGAAQLHTFVCDVLKNR